VHKAPANESIAGVLDLERKLADDEQGPLNEASVNVIRNFPGHGILVWGARTLAPKDRTQWRYVNVRRLLLFIEESIQEGTQFAVFEPNNSGLWATVKRQVSDFLTRVWRDGALIGDTPGDAFKVRIDAELNPPSIVALGQLIIEVIVYPATPAEFVVFRIIQQPGGPSVEE
jgi:phage tail sheath protein FI